jgi:CelD/BcsL family acetyltransferase involved in cellulose biosynthesis
MTLRQLALDAPAWTAFAGGHPDATPFHRPEWAALLARTYRYPAFVLALTDARGGVRAGLPLVEVRDLRQRRRLVSLPFTDACPPLIARDDDTAAQQLAAAVAAHVRRPIEVRGALDAPGWDRHADGVTHRLTLGPDAAQVRAGFHRSQVERSIRRAEREGVEVLAGTGAADLAAFYDLHLQTRRRQGVPVQPRRFFEAIRTEMLGAGLGTLLLARHERRAVAGALFLHGNGTLVYKFGASTPDAWPVRPNHAIFWAAIRAGCERGDHVLDFGRTDLDNTGLRSFKAGWGGRELPLIVSTLGIDHAATEATGPGRAQQAVAHAIRRGPAWVCRGLGAALYRYAGAR